jgi:hypothetical protein
MEFFFAATSVVAMPINGAPAFFSVFMHWLSIIAAVTLGVTFRSLPTFQPRRVPSDWRSSARFLLESG